MNLQAINEQIGRAIWYKGVSLVSWQGEAALASVEGIVVCDSNINAPVVQSGPSPEQRLRFIMPADYAADKPAGLERFAACLAVLLQQCESEKCMTLALPVETLAGVAAPTPELASSIADYLLGLIEKGIACKVLVLASTTANAWLRAGMSRLFTQFREEPGKVYVPTHPHGAETPLCDRGGRAAMSPTDAARCGEFGTWTVTYTVGHQLGNKAEILFAITHPSDWQLPQLANPAGAGYTTVRTNGEAALCVFREPACGSKGFTLHVGVWQGGLKAGDTITLVLGDTSAGSPGLRAQNREQKRQVLKVFGDMEDAATIPWQHNDFTHGLADSPVFDVVAGAPAIFHAIAPSDALIDQPFDLIVRACDKSGNLCRQRVTGKLRLPNGKAVPFVLDPSAPGHATLTGIELDTAGVHRLEMVVDGTVVALSNPIRCWKTWPERRVFWGDLHMHSNLSDGLQDPEQIYYFARHVSGLDIAALGDHDFILGKNNSWPRVVELAKKYHEPGKFVTLLGYEYTERTYGGDRNVYYLDDDGPFLNCQGDTPHPDQLYQRLREHGRPAMVIPHCVIGREDIWRHSDPEFCPLAEVYSTHGCSEAYPNDRPMNPLSAQHNIYGPGTCYTDSFSHGLKMGVIGGTDDHGAQPGWGYSWHDYRGGIMGVQMTELSRQSLWDSLWERRTTATTGERILLDMSVDDLSIGETGTTSEKPTITITAHGTNKIDLVELLRNEQVIHCFHGRGWDETRLFRDENCPETGAWYRCRLTQADGERAWTSPIWIENRKA
jgi:hypothetical protein